MTDPFVPRVGGTVSADIAVPEHDAELRFYSRVLTTGDTPLWRDDLLNNQGTPIIGLGKRVPGYADLPLQWMPHIQVADVAASAKRTLELGGEELMHGKDDAGQSQWAVLRDPNGTAFGIIPVPPAEAMPSVEGTAQVGHISWIDLTVSDASAMRDFYREVVGWSVQEVEMQDASEGYSDYGMVDADGTRAAGLRHARGENSGVPAVWMICLPVGDLAESVCRVGDEGGKVIQETRGEDGQPTRAVIQDPVGVYFSLVQG